MNKDRYNEDDFLGFVSELIDSKEYTGKELGILSRYYNKGYENLSLKQKYVFDKVIEGAVVESCDRCGSDIPWSEMLSAQDNGGLCNYCEHMWNKIKDE